MGWHPYVQTSVQMSGVKLDSVVADFRTSQVLRHSQSNLNAVRMGMLDDVVKRFFACAGLPFMVF